MTTSDHTLINHTPDRERGIHATCTGCDWWVDATDEADMNRCFDGFHKEGAQD